MWSKDKVKAYVARQQAGRTRSPPYEQAALHYARWQGLSEEPQASREAAKRQLDELIARMHPDDWDDIRRIIPKLGEAVFKGVLEYGMRVARARTTLSTRVVAKTRDWPVARKKDQDW